MTAPLSFDTVIEDVFPQKSTPVLRAVLQDENDTGVPAASLTEVKGWLYDQTKKSVIASFSDRNLLNANNCTIDASGNLVLSLLAAEMVLLNEDAAEETHVLQLKWSWSSGNKVAFGRILFRVANLEFVS